MYSWNILLAKLCACISVLQNQTTLKMVSDSWLNMFVTLDYFPGKLSNEFRNVHQAPTQLKKHLLAKK